MAIVIALVAGALTFVAAFFFDLASVKKLSRVKPVTAFLVVAFHGYALYVALYGTDRFWLPAAVSILGWVLVAVFGVLLVFSLIIELPPVRTYYQRGVPGRVITTGTYALTRHPGVMWYIVTMFSLVLATRSTVLLVAVPVWALLNVIFATVEDRYFFMRMFPEYPVYQKQTPMFIPTRRSFYNCLRTLPIRNKLD